MSLAAAKAFNVNQWSAVVVVDEEVGWAGRPATKRASLNAPNFEAPAASCLAA